MNKKAIYIAAVLLIGMPSFYFGVQQSKAARSTVSPASTADEIRDGFQEALDVVQEEYADDVDLESLGKASIQEMLHHLDPHSNFFTKKEFDDLQTEQQSRIYGIGVTIAQRYDHVYILSATPGAPGHRAGLRYGDAIVAIDGQNVKDWKQDQVLHKVRGEKGEPIELTVERPGVAEPITVRIKRDEVKLPTVRTVFMTQQAGTGYIALTGGFAAKTEEELSAAIIKLKQDGMKQLILDLRGNPGGLLDQAIEVAKNFLPGGQKILEVRGRKDNADGKVFRVPENNVPENFPLVILINGGTASASEVVAGALQDHDRALIVGENSFGKGLVQSVKRLTYGVGLTLTTQKYYTPTGRSIQRDYSNVSIYDYYYHRRNGEQEAATQKTGALLTDGGRSVYGGGGITPDVVVKPSEGRNFTTGSVQGRVFNGTFLFVRQLVAGQIASLREYRVHEAQYKNRLTAEDTNRFPIDEKVLAAYREFIAGDPGLNLSEEQFNAKKNYIILELRRELMTAAYGPEAGDQIYLAEDAQFRKAIELLPEAKMLADTVRRASNDKQ